MNAATVAGAIQRDESSARAVLERLVERGLVDGYGPGRGRSYTLSASVYRKLGQSADYVRQAGFDAIQQEQMVMKYVNKHGRIRRKDVMELCHVGPDRATRLLNKLTKSGSLRMTGHGKSTAYERG